MSKHLERDVQQLHRRLMNMSGVVEKMIDDAALAFVERRADLARQVLSQDEQVDAVEVIIEEECLKILALHQPVATDLRRITTVLKINVELERMADLACNIAERAVSMQDYPSFRIPPRLIDMVRESTHMVRMVLDAFVNSDVGIARQVILSDDSIDEDNRRIIVDLKAIMSQEPDDIDAALNCFSASRHIERIADLATNIAEDVIYLVDGEIVRHQHKESLRLPQA